MAGRNLMAPAREWRRCAGVSGLPSRHVVAIGSQGAPVRWRRRRARRGCANDARRRQGGGADGPTCTRPASGGRRLGIGRGPRPGTRTRREGPRRLDDSRAGGRPRHQPPARPLRRAARSGGLHWGQARPRRGHSRTDRFASRHRAGARQANCCRPDGARPVSQPRRLPSRDRCDSGGSLAHRHAGDLHRHDGAIVARRHRHRPCEKATRRPAATDAWKTAGLAYPTCGAAYNGAATSAVAPRSRG